MAIDNSPELLQYQYTEIHRSQGWQDFRRVRAREWDPLLRRHTHADLKLLLAQYGVDADIQSPVLEQDLHERIAIQLQNAAKIDMLSLDSGETAKRNVEAMRIYAAASWLQQDEGQLFSHDIYEAMDRYGIWYGFKTWDKPAEPDYEDQAEGETQAKWASKTLKQRQDYYDSMQEMCFGREQVSPLEMSHFPLDNPKIYMQESIIPYVEARELNQNRDPNKPLRMRKSDGKLIFGQTQPAEEVQATLWAGKKVRRLRRAMLDETTGTWWVSEWVTEASDGFGTPQELDSYECPFGRSPYFHAASGDEMRTETSPHLRFRPMLYALYVKVQEFNALRSLLIKRTIYRLQNPFVVTLYGVQADVMSAVMADNPSLGSGSFEGVGAERKYVWALPQAAEGEVMVAPRLDPMPDDDIQTLMTNIDLVRQEIAELRANRFLTGSGDIGEGPSTSLLDQKQAARTPYSTYHTRKDLMVRDWLGAEFKAMVEWDEDAPKDSQRVFSWKVRGDEPVTHDPMEPGSVVEITASKITSQDYILSSTTSSKTDSERMLEEQAADTARAQGFYTKEEWLKARGADNPQQKLRDLEKQRRQDMWQPRADQIHAKNIETMYLMLTGLRVDLLPPGPQGQTGQSTAPAGSDTPPAPQPPKFGVMSGTAPVVQGPSGGSNPLGPMQ